MILQSTPCIIGLDGRRVHGQPQCLRNDIIVGLPSAFGRDNLSVEGALAPTCGIGAVSRHLSDHHDAASC